MVAMAEKKPKEPISARIAADLVRRLTAMAEADERTFSYMVERAIREFLDLHEHPGEQRSKHTRH